MHLAGLDISTAFLNSDLPRDLPPGIRAIVRLPADCSFESTYYEGVHLDLHKSMNGSKSWLQTCSRILTEKVDLVTCVSEPTVMCGVSKKSGCPTAVMIYVDDLLVTLVSLNGISDVREALQETLKVKTTGTLTTSKGPGGTIVFLGRRIVRLAGSSDILLRVPPDYVLERLVHE